ncbi:large ribosomal subunit protein bL35 [Solicola sp. PLA-1-18]|uniref:large ribosomal subunit protein bL35 n=1 Tax=Solicola sp. PLA-1-18 TaxID=3380532 RepID=UPI003B7EADA0
MPKFKPKSGMKKRVKLTGTGKIMHATGSRRTHLLQKKSSGASRLDGGWTELSKADTKRVKKLLGK